MDGNGSKRDSNGEFIEDNELENNSDTKLMDMGFTAEEIQEVYDRYISHVDNSPELIEKLEELLVSLLFVYRSKGSETSREIEVKTINEVVKYLLINYKGNTYSKEFIKSCLIEK